MKNGRVVDAYGYQEWYENDLRHRLDGPAYISPTGLQGWYANDQLHRIDGPAVIGANGRQEWWVRGVNITEEVTAWIDENNISLPFDDSAAVQFCLSWG